eukprot:COSAG01_NODE_65051_length_274_cov_0.885714_1_plen_78_part_01
MGANISYIRSNWAQFNGRCGPDLGWNNVCVLVCASVLGPTDTKFVNSNVGRLSISMSTGICYEQTDAEQESTWACYV